MKFFILVGPGQRRKWLYYGKDQDHMLDKNNNNFQDKKLRGRE